MSVKAPRKNTLLRAETRSDGSTVTKMVIKRACNGCDRELGDAHPLEIELAFLGKELPDARDECPDCSAAARQEAVDSFIDHMASQDPERLEADRADAWRAERTVDDGLDRLFRRLGPPTHHDNEK